MIKYAFILLTVVFSNDIAKINSLKKEAAAAYKAGNYEMAAQKYSYLVDSMDVMDDQILMNLGNAYFQLKDSANAQTTYNKILPSDNRKMKSLAYQQLGVMADKPETLKDALEYFKESLKADPTNEAARYNYEIVKKKLEKQQQQQNQNQQNQDSQDNQQNKDEQNQEQNQSQDQQQGDNEEQKDQEGEKGENEEQSEQEENQENQQNQDGENSENQDQQQKGDQKQQEQEGEKKEGENKDGEEQEGEEQEGQEGEQQKGEEDEKSREERLKELKEKLEKLNISPEKANNIFESYGNKEIQYLHQLRKRSTKPKDDSKPDW